MNEEKNILQRIFEVAKDTTTDYEISLILTKDNMKEIVQEIDKKYIEKDDIRAKIKERQFELQQEYKDFEDDVRLNTLQEIYYSNELLGGK